MRMLARIALIGLGGVAVFAGVSWTTANRQAAVAPAPVPVVAAPASAPAPAKNAGAGRPAANKPASPAKAASQLRWRDLSIAQQDALMPLVDEWSKLDGTRKQKWIDIANRFGSMKPDEQHRMHERMRDWIKLTPEERRLARENYARSKKIEPAQRSAQWELYQQLPEEEKKKLAADAPQKTQLANLPSAKQSNIKTIAPIKSGVPAAPAGLPATSAPAGGAPPGASIPPAPGAVALAPSAAAPLTTAAPSSAPATTSATPTTATSPAASPAPSNVK